jgi:hypothetical protein
MARSPSLMEQSMDDDYCKSTLLSIDPLHDATAESQLNTVVSKICEHYCPFDLGSTFQGNWNRHNVPLQADM